jgi:hypothetical protein
MQLAVDDPTPSAVLGPDHPLTRAWTRHVALLKQVSAVALVLAVGGIASAAGIRAAVGVVVAAALVAAALGLLALIARSRLHDCVLDVLIQGGEALRIPPVERERRRLLERGYRESLARQLEAVRRVAERPFERRVTPHELLDVRVIAAVAPRIRQIAALLVSERAALPGIAMTERVLSDGTSSLYGRDPEVLKRDLRRIRFLLERQTADSA